MNMQGYLSGQRLVIIVGMTPERPGIVVNPSSNAGIVYMVDTCGATRPGSRRGSMYGRTGFLRCPIALEHDALLGRPGVF
jgi:hypothetical protein